ncbi:MAG: glycosyltransferase family 92 protein [Firmicutes bacterium]|nr:glycosyltransferase family 92 protein [Bacillota bacterium]
MEQHNTLPQGVNYPFYCSICLIIKDENEYLQEWLNWHIGQGVQHFYIYDHGSRESVTDFIQSLGAEVSGLVTVTDWSGPHANAQPDAYNDCLLRFGEENQWIGFIDADEQVRVKTGQPLPEFLKSY